MINYSYTNSTGGFELAQKKEKKHLNFFKFVKIYLKKYAHRFKKNTIRKYKAESTKLKKFRKKIKINKITPDFVNDYEIYMKTVLNNKQNTVNKSLAWIKSVLNKAIDEEEIKKKHNPFRKIKIGYVQGNRDFLTINELKEIEHLKATTKNYCIKETARHFLFSCYTGLRFSDIKNLKFEHIVNNIIVIEQEKTGDCVRIPLCEKANKLINWSRKSEYVFDVKTNQIINKHLKRIAIICEIRKTVTFHVSRHTFATIGITLGIRIAVISKLLGHSNIKTTEIYAKIVDKVRIEAIEKFDFV